MEMVHLVATGAQAPRGCSNPYQVPVQKGSPATRSTRQGKVESDESADSVTSTGGIARFSPSCHLFRRHTRGIKLVVGVVLPGLCRFRKRIQMTTNETAKPCPSKEGKKSKAQIVVTVLQIAGFCHRTFKLIDDGWRWIQNHWDAIKVWLDDLL